MPYITDVFMPIIDSENGDFRMMPFPGTVMDQPYMTMQVLKFIQLQFRMHLADKIEKMKTSHSSSSRSRPRYK